MVENDLILGLFFVLLSILICQQSIGIGLGSMAQPQSGLLPFLTGVWIGVSSLVLLVRNLVKERGKGGLARGEKLIERNSLLAIFSLFCYTMAIKYIGFLLATFLFVLCLLRLGGSRKVWHLLGTAILIVVGNYLIFVVWLKMDLPRGIFNFG
jgi:hypothetical protein